jgi:hypothetical protein
LFAESRNTNELAPMLVASIASLNVAVTVVVLLTPVAPLAGVMAVTVGGVVSLETVVNDQVRLAAMALPAASLTPVLTVAVKVVGPVSAAVGVKVATLVAAL